MNSHATRLTDGWQHVRRQLGGIWEVWRDTPGTMIDWQPVALPHCYNAQDAVDPDLAYYQGEGWYRCPLEPHNPYPGGRTLLHFEGAGQKTSVYAAMELLGTHTGGYDEFTVDLTEAVNAHGDSLPLAVCCDNSRDLEMIPSDLSDFNLYGGLYRYVNLVYVPAVSVERVLVESQVQDGAARVTVAVRLYNPDKRADGLHLDVQLLDPDGSTVAHRTLDPAPWSQANTVLETTLDAPDLWSPDHPALYTCNVTLSSIHGEQQLEERFGVRCFEFKKHGPFYLNGERLLLRGTHRHEDHAGVGAAMTEDQIRQEMTLMKEMGVNFIRLGHYQQSRIVLDLCDELGILVWEEIPWCRGGLGGERYRKQARDMLSSMIDQHRNHPSVIIWGLGNENDWPGDFPEFDQDAIRAFMSELNDLAHELDPNRKTAIRRCAFCKDVVDVYSPSIWAGWYRGRYWQYKGVSRAEMLEVAHFLHVEWGADNHARRHSEDPNRNLDAVEAGDRADERTGDFLMSGGQKRASRDGEWTETYCCDLIDWHLKEQETMDWLTGTAHWPFRDFSTPLRPENPVPYVNQKGVVERDLTPKEAYYVFQSYWTDVPMVRLYGHTWPVRWGGLGQERVVKVYSNCPQAELYLNGASCGTRQRDSQDFPAAGLRWMVVFQPGENHLKVVARKGGLTVTDEIALVYQTEPWGKPAQMVLTEIARDGETATVQVKLLDAQGVLCLDARNRVSFGLAGDGALIDNLGTSTGARTVQVYNGRALISVRLNDRSPANGNRSVISVTSTGLPTQFLHL